MMLATSATVRNRTELSGTPVSGVTSAAIASPFRRYRLRLTIFSAPVTPVSSVIRLRERATPRGGRFGLCKAPATRDLLCCQTAPGPDRKLANVRLPGAKLAPTVARRLDRGEKGGAHPVPFQFSDR